MTTGGTVPFRAPTVAHPGPDESSSESATTTGPRPLPAPIVVALEGVAPRIAPDAFVAPGAVVVGDVEIGPGASVWFNATLRGDLAPVRVGARSNVQDNAVLHVNTGVPCLVGDDVTIGHGAIVHGTTIGDGAMVGMGATILSRSRVGAGAVVAAGALVPEGAEVRAGALVMGVPARETRALGEAERAEVAATAARYVRQAARYRAALAPTGDGETSASS